MRCRRRGAGRRRACARPGRRRRKTAEEASLRRRGRRRRTRVHQANAGIPSSHIGAQPTALVPARRPGNDSRATAPRNNRPSMAAGRVASDRTNVVAAIRDISAAPVDAITRLGRPAVCRAAISWAATFTSGRALHALRRCRGLGDLGPRRWTSMARTLPTSARAAAARATALHSIGLVLHATGGSAACALTWLDVRHRVLCRPPRCPRATQAREIDIASSDYGLRDPKLAPLCRAGWRHAGAWGRAWLTDCSRRFEPLAFDLQGLGLPAQPPHISRPREPEKALRSPRLSARTCPAPSSAASAPARAAPPVR